jgi:hypothetical protein
MNVLQNRTFCKSKLLYCHLRIIYGDTNPMPLIYSTIVQKFFSCPFQQDTRRLISKTKKETRKSLCVLLCRINNYYGIIY